MLKDHLNLSIIGIKKMKNIYIIGAGPSGLITGRELAKKGYSVNIFEKSSFVGGMCRTWKEDSYLLDTGPHIYHTPNKELAEVWKKDFGDILIEGDFWSKNVVDGDVNNLVDYPLSWEQINEFPKNIRTKVLKELSQCDQTKSIGTNNFKDYVTNLVGETLTEMFFTKYPEKVWGIPTHELTADWAPKRIEIRKKKTPFYTNQFAAVGKYGTGCVYQKIADDFKSLGGIIHLENALTGLKFNSNTISELILKDDNIKLTDDDIVISTIPITLLGYYLGIKSNLEFRGINSVYVSTKKNNISWPENTHWLYFDYSDFAFNRITNSTSLSPHVSPKDEILLTIESTYSKNDKIDSFKKLDLEKYILDQLVKSKILKNKNDIKFSSSNKEPFVYPLQYPGFQIDLATLKSGIEKYKNLYSIGTGGDFNYADSQVLFHKAYDLVATISGSDSKINQIKKTNSLREFNNSFYIGDFKVGGENSKPMIIGEIGLNHNGNYDLALKLIDKAKECGLKFVKLQTYKSGNSRVSDQVKSANYVEKITDQEETLTQMFDKYNLTLKEQKKLFSYAKKIGLTLFSTPFDIDSANFLNDVLDVDCFKIASVDLVNLPLLGHVSKFNKPMILSCGMSNLSEIEDALDVIANNGNKNIVLLHCNSSYPAPLEEMNLSVINTLNRTFKVPSGLSDHTFGLLAATISMSIGANVVERHFTLDRLMDGPDHILSSEPDEMKTLVAYSNSIPKILGNGIKKIQDGEYFNINLQRKCLYLNKSLKRGDKIKDEDISIKGPGGGILPKFMEIVVGRELKEDLEKDFPITWNLI